MIAGRLFVLLGWLQVLARLPPLSLRGVCARKDCREVGSSDSLARLRAAAAGAKQIMGVRGGREACVRRATDSAVRKGVFG